MHALPRPGGTPFFIDIRTGVRQTLTQSRLLGNVRRLRPLANLAVNWCEPRMASSLSLISSAPDPGKKPPHSADSQKSSDIGDTAQTFDATRKPVNSRPAQPVSSEASVATATAPALEDMLTVLRRNVAEESRSADSLIRATSEAALALTGADGVAIAFRSKGVITCRARSGELAPDLGSCVNANSGISGECLRTASILVCHDTRTDSRVDNEVCQKRGIGSIVVVPLRGPVGIAGILEVFSARGNAFGTREINSLRGLAEIAEAAYLRERQAQQEATRAALRSAHRLPALLARAAGSEKMPGIIPRELTPSVDSDSRPERSVWLLGGTICLLLLIAGIWLSWHGPISELAELEAAQNQKPPAQLSTQPKTPTPPKPDPGIVRPPTKKLAARAGTARTPRLRPVETIGIAQAQSSPEAHISEPIVAAGKTDALSNAAQSASTDSAPLIPVNAAQNHAQFPSLLSDREPLPVMGSPISRGVTQGQLIRRVDPVYPAQAQAEGITGPVVLEIHVGNDGSVRHVSSARGDPLLVTAAEDAVRQWQYAPTLLDGRPVETTRQVTVVFKLP